MKHLNMKEINPDSQAGKTRENTRQPESRYSGQRARHGRATTPYIVARLFSCTRVRQFLLIALLILAGSCVKDVREGAADTGDGEHLVTLSFTVPGPPSSRAMNESAVETVDVLLFDQGTDKIVYRAIGTTPVSGQFSVKLPANTYNMVVLANARAMIPAAYPAATTGASLVKDTRETVLAAITKSIAPVSHQWPTTFDRLPMWGYSNNFTVGTSAPTISLTRMIAKIDVIVGAAVNNFWIESARLYNYTTAGTIAPAVKTTAPNHEGYDPTQWNNVPDGLKARAPHLAGAKAADDYLAYNADPSNTKKVIEYKNNIYAFEAVAGVAHPATGWKQNTCLVIGGYYQDMTTPTYYRVEFENTASGFLPLLRNHRYDVTIIGVSGHGYPTPEDAYANKPANITVTIVPWDGGGLDDITFDGQHNLAVDKSELVFYATGSAKSLEVTTDFPGGWTVTKAAFPSWLTITAPVPVSDIASGAAGVQTRLTLTATPTTSPRFHEFYIIAGNLEKKITVRQLAEEEFSLEVSPSDLVFYSAQSTPKRVDILTYPVADGSAYKLTYTQSGTVAWASSSSSTFTGSAAAIQLLPTNRTPGATGILGGTLLVTLTGTSGRTMTRVINVRQLDRLMAFQAFPANPYPAAGGTFTFPVVSEGPWKLAKNPADTYLALETGEGATFHDITSSYSYPVTLTSNVSSYAARTATISVTSSDTGFPSPLAFDIVQSGTPPRLVITSPTDGGNPPVHEHNFGSGSTPVDVTFKTNTRWKFSGDANFSTIVDKVFLGASEIAANAVQSETTPPTADVTRQLSFRPLSTSGNALAGSSQTLVTLTTANPHGAPEASDAVTLFRLIPPDWTIISAVAATTPAPPTDKDLSPAATSVRLIAKTNIRWYGQRIDAAGSWSKVLSTILTVPLASEQIIVPVTARPWNKATSWSTDTTVYIRAGYDAIPPFIPAHADADRSFTRGVYTLSTSSPGSIAYAGGNVTLTVTTNAPTYTISFRNKSTQAILVSGTSSTTTVTVAVPANPTANARDIEIINGISGTIYHTVSQNGVPPHIVVGPYTVKASGNNPDINSYCPAGYHNLSLSLIQYYEPYYLTNGQLANGDTYRIATVMNSTGAAYTEVGFSNGYLSYIDDYNLPTQSLPIYFICIK
ncbi:MAG: FimB/Mfa2 family fimbrial subunit [Odoribacteraceae bacterium]|jgi:hypothetical protein|nr:FimB/Mfa2 family fimbrial subunit [Odoribacteraceae bacterium]